jgi:alkylation response protein AidB-like acyl-CoA dehydrogenase
VDFEFSEEQEQLRESVRRFLADRAPISYVRTMYDDPVGTTPEVWKGLADLGVLDPALGMIELGVVLEEMGRVVHPGPFLSSAVGAASAIAAVAPDDQLLERLADGSVIATLAIDLERVPDAAAADVVLVPDGHDLYAVDDFDVRPMPTPDGTRKVGAVSLNERGRCIGRGDLQSAIDRWMIGYVVDGVGAASAALDLAVAYGHERVQFDRPIGSFQAVQHLCADMLTSLELGRVGAYYGLWAADHESAEELHRAATMAKAFAGDAFFRIGADAIQVFAGIGYTWEHDIHLFYKRLLTLQHTLGSTREHLEELMSIVLASTKGTSVP